MNNIKFVAIAREEFFAEVNHYNTVKKGLGLNFTVAVEKTVNLALELALEFPHAGFPFAADTRRIIVKGFPIFLVYKLSPDNLVIYAVVNQSRRSGYWCSRVETNHP